MKINKLNTKRKKGVTLVLVISIIGFMGVVMLFLSSASNTMSFQANDVYLQACKRNLTSSGLSWAKTNIKNGTITDFNDTIPLDVNDMDILHSSLELIITSPIDGQNEVKIKTSCGKASQSLTANETYTIEQ
ncbi:MAG: hypothetical protein JXA96_17690 [Sedimentisphaerales bacterium]|nr:hypothetical protein [Sedimentisphaerales bacterium]